MRRLLRWASHFSALVSALLLVGVCALWVRSYRQFDAVRVRDKWVDGQFWKADAWELSSESGRLELWRVRDSYTPGDLMVPPQWKRSPEPRLSVSLGERKPPFHGWLLEGNGGKTSEVRNDLAASVSFAWVMAPPLAIVAAWVVRRARRRRRARPGHCPRCGYDLRATPDRCPECGRVPDGKGAS